jgi:hypothetical protein
MSNSEKDILPFIELTPKYSVNNGKTRFNKNKIFMYGEYYQGGSYIMFDGNWGNHFAVEETPEQIDEMIKGN